MYGDHLHDNPGTHLRGGIAEDAVWQARWKRLVSLTGLSFYTAPKGKVGRQFVQLLSDEWQAVIDRKWNSERPLVFPMVVLATKLNVKAAKDVRSLLEQRMSLWMEGKFDVLVDDAEDEVYRRIGSGTQSKRSDEAIARSFNETVLGGRLRQAVRRLTQRDGGGVMLPSDIDAKSGQSVEQVLRDKHPTMWNQQSLRRPAGRHRRRFPCCQTSMVLAARC